MILPPEGVVSGRKGCTVMGSTFGGAGGGTEGGAGAGGGGGAATFTAGAGAFSSTFGSTLGSTFGSAFASMRGASGSAWTGSCGAWIVSIPEAARCRACASRSGASSTAIMSSEGAALAPPAGENTPSSRRSLSASRSSTVLECDVTGTPMCCNSRMISALSRFSSRASW